MTTKRSAFSVFRTKEKLEPSLSQSDEDDLTLVSVKKTESTFEVEKAAPKSPRLEKSKQKTKSEQKSKSEKKLKSEQKPKAEQTPKGEQRFANAIRKSMRKKSKKDGHHEIALKENGKESKFERVVQSLERSNWTESLQSLDSTVLEEEFLPGVVKQKKEQKKLNQANSTSSLPVDNPGSKYRKKGSPVVGDKRRRSGSLPSTDFSLKPPIPKKKLPSLTLPESESSAKKSPKDTDEENQLNDCAHVQRSIASAEKLFAWLIGPVKAKQFFSDVWQKKPLFIKRRQPKYNDIWFSTKEFDKILRKQNVQYTKNLDIAIFRNGKRETMNPDGRAFAPQVWRFYNEGYSVRLLNPATFSSNVWHLSAKLQEQFGCLVGSNVYLTPPGAQGFAPHYDDIEAFVIQLEGRKRWRLYSSRNLDEILPRNSSENMDPEELGEPILDRVLEPGDALYFPRGVIHQAVTPKDGHSLHITLSVCQKLGWSDLMEKLIPLALQTAIEEDIEFRQALPIGFNNHVGVSNSEKSTDERRSLMKTVEQLMKKLVSYVSVDQAADELVLDQMDEFLPPSLTTAESDRTVFGNGAYWNDGKVHGTANVTMDTNLRIIRPGVVRLIPTDDMLQIHNTVQNSRQYKELPMNVFEIPLDYADVAEYFLFSYPKYVCVSEAPIDDDDVKLDVAREFYARGLLSAEEPLAGT